jgi:hypothetical protein
MQTHLHSSNCAYYRYSSRSQIDKAVEKYYYQAEAAVSTMASIPEELHNRFFVALMDNDLDQLRDMVENENYDVNMPIAGMGTATWQWHAT